MTVPSEDNREDYLGNGSATVFPVTFRFLEDDHLTVIRTNADDSTEILDLGQDYTVEGAGTKVGGSITFPQPLPSGAKLTIVRQLEIIQETDLRNQGAFYSETHEDTYDYSRMVDQQLKEELGRALRFDITLDPDFDPLLGVPPEPYGLIGVNGDADGMEYVTTDDTDHPVIAAINAATALAQQALDVANAAFTTAQQAAEDAAAALAAARNQNTANVILREEEVLATAGQTLFTVPGGFEVGTLAVFVNGVRQHINDQYTADPAGNTVTLTQAAGAGDEVLFAILETSGGSGSGTGFGGEVYDQSYTATSGQTDFVFTVGFDAGDHINVFHNGVKQSSADFSTNADTETITLAAGAQAGDVIQVEVYDLGSSVAVREEEFTATAGQSSFEIPGGYNVGTDIAVWLNGIRLAATDWSRPDNIDINLASPAKAGDTVQILLIDS